MQHITMLVGINDDGDENNDVLFENRDVVSSLVVETELRVLVVTSGDHYHQLGPRDTVWGTFTLSTFHFHSWALEILSGGILTSSTTWSSGTAALPSTLFSICQVEEN